MTKLVDGSLEFFLHVYPEDSCPFQTRRVVISPGYLESYCHLECPRVLVGVLSDSAVVHDSKKSFYVGVRRQVYLLFACFQMTLPPVFLRTFPDRELCTVTPTDAAIRHA